MAVRRRLAAALGMVLWIGSAAAAESPEQRIERLEHEVDDLKHEIQELKKQNNEPAAPAVSAAPATAPSATAEAGPPSAKPSLLERKCSAAKHETGTRRP